MTLEDVSRQIAGKGLSSGEAAAYQKMCGAPFDKSLVPPDKEKDLLTGAYLKLGDRYPKDSTGLAPWHVSRPTIVPDELPSKTAKLKRVCIQWNARTERGNLSTEFQFRFALTTLPDNKIWQGVPEKFQVLFIGPADEWPDEKSRETALALVKGAKGGLVAWVGMMMQFETTSFASQVFSLANSALGIVMPQTCIHRYALELEPSLPCGRGPDDALLCGNCGSGIFRVSDAARAPQTDTCECARCAVGVDFEHERCLNPNRFSIDMAQSDLLVQGDLVSMHYFCARCKQEHPYRRYSAFSHFSALPQNWIILPTTVVCPDCEAMPGVEE